jgi:hypothetical protein
VIEAVRGQYLRLNDSTQCSTLRSVAMSLTSEHLRQAVTRGPLASLGINDTTPATVSTTKTATMPKRVFTFKGPPENGGSVPKARTGNVDRKRMVKRAVAPSNPHHTCTPERTTTNELAIYCDEVLDNVQFGRQSETSAYVAGAGSVLPASAVTVSDQRLWSAAVTRWNHAPQRYRCLAPKAVCRASFELLSMEMGCVEQGEEVDATESCVNGRGQLRLRIAGGWVSLVAGTGAVLFEKVGGRPMLLLSRPRELASLSEPGSPAHLSLQHKRKRNGGASPRPTAGQQPGVSREDFEASVSGLRKILSSPAPTARTARTAVVGELHVAARAEVELLLAMQLRHATVVGTRAVEDGDEPLSMMAGDFGMISLAGREHYTVYTINVSLETGDGPREFSIERRFSDFVALDLLLRPLLQRTVSTSPRARPGAAHAEPPRLPAKRWWGHMRRSVVHERVHGIQLYLDAIAKLSSQSSAPLLVQVFVGLLDPAGISAIGGGSSSLGFAGSNP